MKDLIDRLDETLLRLRTRRLNEFLPAMMLAGEDPEKLRKMARTAGGPIGAIASKFLGPEAVAVHKIAKTARKAGLLDKPKKTS